MDIKWHFAHRATFEKNPIASLASPPRQQIAHDSLPQWGAPRFSPSPTCFTSLCLNVVNLSLAKLMRGGLMRCLHLLSNSSGRIPCRTLEALPRLAHFTSGLEKAAAQLKAVARASASAWQQQKHCCAATRGVAAAAMPDDVTYLCAYHCHWRNLLRQQGCLVMQQWHFSEECLSSAVSIQRGKEQVNMQFAMLGMGDQRAVETACNCSSASSRRVSGCWRDK